MGPQDAEQNLFHTFDKGLDMADLLEVRAPKPTLMVTTTRDIFSIEGAREVFDEAKIAYRNLGAAPHLTMVEDDAGHASTQKNREASYAFFQKYLQNPGSNEDTKVSFFSDEELFVTPTGNVYSSLKGETFFSLIQKDSFRRLKEETKVPPHALTAKVASLMNFVPPKSDKKSLFSGRLAREGYVIEKYLVSGPGDYYLPVLWFKPQKATNKIVLYINTKGKEAVAQNAGIAEQLVKEGYNVVLPDLSGAGELSNGYIKDGDSFIDSTSLNLWYTSILTNKSLVGIRAEEIQLTAEFIKQMSGTSSITAIASGTFSTDLLHAALVTKAFDQLALLNGLVSYRSIIEQEHYRTKFMPSVVAGALPFYDLPDLIRILAPRRIFLQGIVDAADQPISQQRIEQIYADAIQVHSNHRSLQIGQATQADEQMRELLRWLRSNKN
jgi:hypothetical protein